MASDRQGRRLPAITLDPTGELHGNLPTYPWNQAPEGLATRRQLAKQGLRPGGQQPVAQTRRNGWVHAYLYRVDLAKPQFALTPAKLAAVWTAARSRQRCGKCERTNLGYIPQQGAPAYGRCWDCMGLPAVAEPDPDLWVCPGCQGTTEIECPACNGHGRYGECSGCAGSGIMSCPTCQGF